LKKSLSGIAGKAKKSLKQEHRQMIDDWELLLDGSAADCEENEFTTKEAMRAKRRAKRRAARKRTIEEPEEAGDELDYVAEETEDLEFRDDEKENIVA
jgi:hypothetical protein